MKILIDARSMGSKPSGIGMYIYNFAKELIKKEDVKIVLTSDVAISAEMDQMERFGAQIEVYGKKINKNLGLWGYYRYIQKLIHDIKPDIFWEGNNLFPIKLVNPYGKIITTVHDIFPITTPQYYGKLYECYFKYGMKNTLKYVDVILYNSCETKREMENVFPQAAGKETFISYIIVDKVLPGKLTDEGYFLYVGNLEKRKGTDLLLDGYRKYLEYGGTKKLKFAGKIREEDIGQKIEEITHQIDSVEYMGYLSEEEKQQAYSSCSAFLFPSKAEGFGMPVIEVMNYEKPVIASDLSIFTELVGESINYFSMTEQKEQDVEALAKKMMQYDQPDLVEYGKITNKYSEGELTERLYRCFKELVH